ncbi:hypothetical protein DOK67_0000792 [Enterococcus sp. DIV0212c]|uniref:LPXTG cell wall anchor domain-containing protein n=1 Tax=Enterococcus sp. DIV0212c TaxID=2230867 RepID=UPI001A9AF7AC|nr:LPXTG cell wall anchor domain-containing protein [Enterococcus sp. DIV0212c]MBO1354995.1 LPXTG cell wall anchor domain-containing protein [Enterococcus sp. DIV0212c]
MNNNSFYIRAITSLFCLMIFSLIGIQAMAEENGGVVGTKGEIILQEEINPSSEPPTSTTDTTNSSIKSSNSEPTKAKPVGRYPSTGELAKTGLSIGGLILLIAALFLFIWKQRSKRKGANEDEA